ncbi:hypothetical protein J4H86_08565 [Spiractinospora alimapuensis]|uniref:hypothetical protein n=1 Tax=Spiractinospora alimapuensis TaxID=2820884 RepID=UPI001F2C2C71|nr:hypothetical protein [Spiractinospora alimapuensis]QVQ53753.1 hypothetical protein J4H86_08565 [Spiractinospora alimapuensis]
MLDPNWVFLGAALGLVGSLRYAWATLRGHARPNRVTWFLWAAAPLIGFLAQLDDGIGPPAILTLGAGVGPLVVLAASFLSRHGAVAVTGFDLACGAIAAAALVVWLGLGSAPLGVLFAVGADAAGAIPTVRKAWRDPHSENALFFVFIAAGAGLTLLTITEWEPAAWAFAAYMLTLSLLLTTAIVLRRRTRVVGTTELA